MLPRPSLQAVAMTCEFWWLYLRDQLLSCAYQQSKHEPSLFGAYNSSGKLVSVVCSHVDDPLSAFARDEEGDELRVQVMQKLNIGKHAVGDFVYTGRRFQP